MSAEYDQLEAALDTLFDASPDKVKFLRLVLGWHANFCDGCAQSLDGGNKPWRCACEKRVGAVADLVRGRGSL